MNESPGDGEAETPPRREDTSASEDGRRRGKKLVTGLAFGIGSAAIVAALLCTRRSRDEESDQ